MKLNILFYTLIIFASISCNPSSEMVDSINGKWTLSSTSGNQGNLILDSPWTVIEIKDRNFQLLNVSDGEEEIARGTIEFCNNSVLSDCYEFVIDYKKVGITLPMESSNDKIISYIDSELSFTSICCNQISYYFEK